MCFTSQTYKNVSNSIRRGYFKNILFHYLVFGRRSILKDCFYCFAEGARDKERGEGSGGRVCVSIWWQNGQRDWSCTSHSILCPAIFDHFEDSISSISISVLRISISSLFCLRLVLIISISFLPLTSSLISPSIQNAVSYHSVQWSDWIFSVVWAAAPFLFPPSRFQ